MSGFDSVSQNVSIYTPNCPQDLQLNIFIYIGNNFDHLQPLTLLARKHKHNEINYVFLKILPVHLAGAKMEKTQFIAQGSSLSFYYFKYIYIGTHTVWLKIPRWKIIIL